MSIDRTARGAEPRTHPCDHLAQVHPGFRSLIVDQCAHCRGESGPCLLEACHDLLADAPRPPDA